ncbi:MAG TPA: hypothetical protein VGL40_06700 [Bacillota bacterium]|jgi:L-aspartate oxidase
MAGACAPRLRRWRPWRAAWPVSRRLANGGILEAIEVGNLVRVARMVAAATLVREESRGVHYRTDAPAGDPSWLRHLAVVRGPDGSPRVIPSDVGVVGLGE